MSEEHGACSSCSVPTNDANDPRYRRILWIALILNAAMFFVEIYGGVLSGSLSLLADAVDFAGDAANYGLSLMVLSLHMGWRSRTALIKGLSMGAYGAFVLVKAVWALGHNVPPEPLMMGSIAMLALLVNVSVAAMLYTWRSGDANMRSVWLCSRNDAISNIAVGIAAIGVFGTKSAWPDLAVAGIMAGLALTSSVSVVRHALQEMKTAK